MKKKILAMFLAMLMFSCIFTVTSVSVGAKSTEEENQLIKEGKTSDGWLYNVDIYNNANIVGYSGSNTTATLPINVGKYKVGGMVHQCLKNSKLTKLIIPDVDVPISYNSGETRYFNDAFASATNLKEVVIGSMFAESIPDHCFRWCPKLEKITFTEDFTKKALATKNDVLGKEVNGCIIQKYAFADCPSIKTMVIPEGVAEIWDRAFENDNIENFVIPTTVKSFDIDGLLIYSDSAKMVKNIVVKGENTLVSYGSGFDDDFINVKYYCHPSSPTVEFLDYLNLKYTDITTVNTDELIKCFITGTQPSVIDTKTDYQYCLYNTTLNVKKNTSAFSVKTGGKYVTYNSLRPDIAKVDSKGIITGVKAGKTTIEIKNKDTHTFLKVNVTVKMPTPKLNKTYVKIKRGKAVTLKIANKVTKANYYKIQNGKRVKTVKNFCTINNAGKIYINKKAKVGSTFTVCVNVNNKTLRCKVKVIK